MLKEWYFRGDILGQKPFRKFFTQQLLSRVPGWFFAFLVITSLTSAVDREAEGHREEWGELDKSPGLPALLSGPLTTAEHDKLVSEFSACSPNFQTILAPEASVDYSSLVLIPAALFNAATARPRSPPALFHYSIA